MNNAGEITELVSMVRPHVAIITNIAAAHIGAFDTIEDIARAKAEIYSGITPGGHALINHDDKRYLLLRDLAEEASINNLLSFGTKRGSDIWLRELYQNDEGSKLSVRINGTDMEYSINVPGEHMAMNSLAVLGAAYLVDADIEKTLDAMNKVEVADGRGTRYQIGGSGAMGITVIDESYNANPASMEAGLLMLGNFATVRTKRRIAVLGDMLELGNQSRKLHEELARPISAAKVDLVFLMGQEMEHLAGILPKDKLGGHFTSVDALVDALKIVMKPGDVVMLKASNSMRFSSVVQKIIE